MPSAVCSPGPRPASLLLLAITALALLATGAPFPVLEARAVGQAWIGPGETVEREVQVHLDPGFAATATDGTIVVGFESANGLEEVSSADAAGITIRLVGATDGADNIPPDLAFPIERCRAGCDLTYRLAITADRVLPGSTARYTVDVRLVDVDGGSGPSGPGQLQVEVEDPAPVPPIAVWLVVLGILAVVVGVVVGPAVDARLGEGRRRRPAAALVAVLVLAIAIPAILRLATLVGAIQHLEGVSWILPAVGFLIDPWSSALLGILAWGVWRGRDRWPDDGGWLLGLAAAAVIGVGGLWLVWTTTREVVINPFMLGGLYVAVGGLAGAVVGQGWRVDPRAWHDRAWAAPGVVAHGILIAGFGFLASTALDPSIPSAPPAALILLVPAALLGFAFRRWLHGKRVLAILLDVAILAIGLLGWLSWQSLASSGGGGPDPMADIAIGVAVVAAAVATVTAFHRMPGPAEPAVTTDESPVPAPATTG